VLQSTAEIELIIYVHTPVRQPAIFQISREHVGKIADENPNVFASLNALVVDSMGTQAATLRSNKQILQLT